MPADAPTELFDVVDPATGAVTGTLPRSVCHATGAWHRSAHVFVSDAAGRHLLQRRALAKDVAPGAWDMACTEHVAAGGEAVADAAVRGLAEELGIQTTRAALGPPLSVDRAVELRAGRVWDRELVTTFWLRGLDGGVELRPDAAEVAATAWADAAAVRALCAADGGARVTPWLVGALRAMPQLLQGEATVAAAGEASL